MAYDLVQSQPNVWQPNPGESSKLLQTACEVTALSLKSGGGATTVSFYDCKDLGTATPNALRWVLDSAQAGNDNQSFPSALIFRKGFFAICGEGLDFNASVCFATKKLN